MALITDTTLLVALLETCVARWPWFIYLDWYRVDRPLSWILEPNKRRSQPSESGLKEGS